MPIHASKPATGGDRYGNHVRPDRATGGSPAPIRNCSHYDCRDGFHNPDCATGGVFSVGNPRLNRPRDAMATSRPKARHGQEER